MTRSAKWTLAVVIALVGGSLAAHLGIALYLRSDAYLKIVSTRVGQYFQMPCDMARVVRMTLASTGYDGVQIWLPDRRDRVFHCDRAVWNEVRVDGESKIDLDLLHGTLALGTDKWRLEDYRQVLESGLRHDFDQIRSVRLDDFAITFRRKNLLLSTEHATGTIQFATAELGLASLQAYVFNGAAVREPIRIHARFLPHEKALIDEMSLEIPAVPLAGLQLEAALGSPVTRGQFAGRLEYREASPQPLIALEGRLFDIDLAEMTARLPTGPLRGTAEVTLDRAELAGKIPTLVRGRARLSDVALTGLGRLLGLRQLSGTAELNVAELEIERGHVNRLLINGRVRDVEVTDLLSPLGKGEATGRLTLLVNALRIEHDRIVAADIDISAAPAAGTRGTIDRELLLGAAEKLAGFSWPTSVPKRLLPAKIEYAQFGLRLLVSDNQLRVLGTHGDNNATILTIRLFGAEFGLVQQWPGVIDLTPWVDELLGRIAGYDPRDVRKFIPSASQPGQ